MNSEALVKLIRAIILPQFPFIVDFEVNREVNEPLIGIRVVYYVTKEYKRETSFGELNNNHSKLNDLTKNMFKMIGFPPHVIFLPIYMFTA